LDSLFPSASRKRAQERLQRLQKSAQDALAGGSTNATVDRRGLDELVASLNASLPLEEGLGVFVREDGTVDLDRAVETGKEVVRFSAELWERLNGQAPEQPVSTLNPFDQEGGGGEGGQGRVLAQGLDAVLKAVEADPLVEAARVRLVDAQANLAAALHARKPPSVPAPAAPAVPSEPAEAAVAAGAEAAGAGGTLAGAAARRKLLVGERAAVRRARLAALDYDMERSCGVVALEIDQSSSEAWTESWRAEQRRLVAEFGLLDAQLAVLLDVLEGATQKKSAAPSGGVPSPARGPPGKAPGSSGASEGSEGSDEWREFVGLAAPGAGAVPASEEAGLLAKDLELVDELVDWDELLLARIDPDELDVVASQVVDLVSRLGIRPADWRALVPRGGAGAKDGDWFGSFGEAGAVWGGSAWGGGALEPMASLVPAERLAKQAVALGAKLQSGISFYATGCKLLGDDINYALTLLLKALQGTTLSGREARTLRRTAKDLVTVVPVVIILLIPLSPIGHVLVFSFIQRIFPDFFPSPFTERRQNLMKLYDAIAPPDDDDDPNTPWRRL